MHVDDILFVGFNSRIAALDVRNGDTLWQWKAPKGTGFVSVLVDRETLYASVNGYTYALDPNNGTELWMNPMKGFGFGVTSLATTRASTSDALLGEKSAQQARQAAQQHHHG